MPNCPLCQPGAEREATHVVWCPTWLNCHNGPINVCETCSIVFRQAMLTGGSFHWGDEAHAAFKSVERFIPTNDPAYDDAQIMLTNLGNEDTYWRRVFVIEGKAWLHTFGIILCLGEEYAALKMFPKLFEQEQPRF